MWIYAGGKKKRKNKSGTYSNPAQTHKNFHLAHTHTYNPTKLHLMYLNAVKDLFEHSHQETKKGTK